MADDFCSGATAQSLGILRGTAYWYSNWTGRFSANLLDSLFGYLGPSATPLVTGFVILIWFAGLNFAARSTFKLIHDGVPASLSLLTAAVILFVVFEVTPSVAQSLYWGQGMRSVVPPLILAAVFAGLFAKSVRSPSAKFMWIAGAAVLTFIAGGFSETYVAVQTTGLAIALLICVVRRKRNAARALIVAGLIGSVIALCVVAAAPGNSIRRTPFPDPPGLPGLLKISWAGFADFFAKILASTTNRFVVAGLIAFAFVLGGLLLPGQRRDAMSSRTILLIPIISFVLLFTCHVPIAFGASLNLPDRALIIPAFVLAVALFAWFVLLGGKLRTRLDSKSWTMPVAVALFCGLGVTAVFAGVRRARLVPAFRQYARDWNARHELIRAAKARGEQYVQVPRLFNWAALDEVEPDPKIFWLAKCVQDYYGIRVVTEYRGPADPTADYQQRQITLAAEAIRPLSHSSPAPLDSYYKPSRGVVRFYTSGASFDQVRTHYETELARNGWKLFGDRKIEVFQKYDGAMHVLFCKDGYAANLFYTGGEAPRLGYNYSIAFNWGLSSGFVWGKDDCK